MKKNIFFLMFAVFCINFSLDAKKPVPGAAQLASKMEKLKIEEGKAHVSDDDKEMVELAPGLSMYRKLEKNDLKALKERIKKKFSSLCVTSDYVTMMGMIDAIAKRDSGNEGALIDQDSITECLMRAFIDKNTRVRDTLNQHRFLKENKLLAISNLAQKNLALGCFLTLAQGRQEDASKIQFCFGSVEDKAPNKLMIFVDGEGIQGVPDLPGAEVGDQLIVLIYSDHKNIHVYHHSRRTKKLTEVLTGRCLGSI